MSTLPTGKELKKLLAREAKKAAKKEPLPQSQQEYDEEYEQELWLCLGDEFWKE